MGAKSMRKVDKLLEFDNTSRLVKEKLSAGTRIKNRKAMCETLGMQYTRGNNARDSDERVWSRLFSWVKEGNAYVVTRVFQKPMPKPFDKRDLFSANNLICLSTLEHDGLMLTKGRLYELCGYVGSIWNNDELASERLTKFADENGYSFQQTQYFYKVLRNHVGGYCGQHIENSLSRISERQYLQADKVVMVKIAGIGPDRQATEKERGAYLTALAQVREKKGRNLILTKEWEVINAHLRDILDIPDMTRMYEVFRLHSFDRELIERFCSMAETGVDDAKRETNERVLEILKGRMPKEVSDGNYRLALSMYGEERLEHGTAVTVPLLKDTKLLEQDRIKLIDALVAI